MPETRAEIDEMLDRLEALLPQLIMETPSPDLMDAFDGLADPIREVTAPADVDHLDSRLNAMLEDNDLVPYAGG